jgi:hypothetical protein
MKLSHVASLPSTTAVDRFNGSKHLPGVALAILCAVDGLLGLFDLLSRIVNVFFGAEGRASLFLALLAIGVVVLAAQEAAVAPSSSTKSKAGIHRRHLQVGRSESAASTRLACRNYTITADRVPLN